MSNIKIFACNGRVNRIELSLRIIFFCLIFFVTIISPFNTDIIFGQNFKSWAIEESLASKRDEIMTAMKQGNVSATNRTDWNAFFDKYYFARWTVEGNAGFVQNYVRDLISKDLKDSTGAARTFFLTKSLETLTKMTNDKSLNPTARYNAILAIGQLTFKEAAANNDPPAYFEDALKQLVTIYDNNTTPEYIRVGALVGIVRHAIAGISNEDYKNNKVPAIFIKTINSNRPAADQDPDERAKLDWLRMRAFDGLAALKVVNSNIVTVVKDVIRSDIESYEMRGRAARLMGELDLQSADDKTKTECGQVSPLLISLAKSYCDSEIAKIDSIATKASPEGQPARRPNIGLRKPSIDGGGIDSGEINSGTGETKIIEPPFASLPPEIQREVAATVQRIKTTSLYYILFGMRGRLPGPTSSGIVTVLKSGDPNWEKVNNATKSLASLIEILDKGKTETTTGGTRPRPNPAATKGQHKVNFTVIREALQKCSDDLSEIITGKKVEPAQPKK
jgi:hypothetical protein